MEASIKFLGKECPGTYQIEGKCTDEVKVRYERAFRIYENVFGVDQI